MDIAQYISDLLIEHKEVNLPGIGTFFKRNVSAYYDEGEKLFHPPSYRIEFREEDQSDSILADHIVATKNISQSSALYFIERFIENTRKALQSEASADISPLGELVKTDAGYVLKPGATSLAETSSYGLVPVKEADILGPAENPTAKSGEDQIEDEDEDSSSGSKTIWIVLMVLLVLGALAAAAYYYYPQYFKQLNSEVPKKVIPKRKVLPPVVKRDSVKDSLEFADSLMQNLEKQGIRGAEVEKAPDSISISTSKAASTKPAVKDTVRATPKPAKVYEVIIASFGLKREAENAVRAYRKNGIDAKVVVDKNKPRFKVSIGTFNTMASANKEKRRIQAGENKEAWILTVKNNDTR